MASITEQLKALIKKLGGEANGKTISGCLEDLCGCEIGGGDGNIIELRSSKSLGEITLSDVTYDGTQISQAATKLTKGEVYKAVLIQSGAYQIGDGTYHAISVTYDEGAVVISFLNGHVYTQLHFHGSSLGRIQRYSFSMA